MENLRTNSHDYGGSKPSYPRMRGIQYAVASRFSLGRLWNTGPPAFAGDDSMGAYAAGTGSAVTDLIFSIAKREVTFFSGTALISFL